MNIVFAKSARFITITAMKPVLWILASCALALTFTSCGNGGGGGGGLGGPQAVTGPYDRNGNYIEEWANDPSKWPKQRGTSSPHVTKSDELPQIAKIEQPPENAVPVAQGNPTKTVPIIAQTEVTSRPKTSPEKSGKVVTRKKRPVDDDDDKPTVRAKTKSKTTASNTKTSTKTKATTTKTKPKSSRYVVKKGESLSTIASKTGASVSAIKSANGISGSLIRPGQSLVIPKR